MPDLKKLGRYKNIIGRTKESIEAIQRFLDKHSENKPTDLGNIENPAASINRVIKSVESEETTTEIQKIIKNL